MIATWERETGHRIPLFNLPTGLLDSAIFKVLKADCFSRKSFFSYTKVHVAPVDCAMQTYIYIICVHGVNALMEQGYLYMLPVSPMWSVPNTIDSLISRFSAQKIDETQILKPHQRTDNVASHP